MNVQVTRKLKKERNCFSDNKRIMLSLGKYLNPTIIEATAFQ